MPSHPLFSPDGTQVAFVGHEHGDHWNRNFHLLLAPVRGRASVTSLTADSDLSVNGLPLSPLGAPYGWRPEGSGLLFLAGDRGAVLSMTVALGKIVLISATCRKLLGSLSMKRGAPVR